jgi:porphobilinogen synthase
VPAHFALGRYPHTRLRRLRSHSWSRKLVAENIITPADLIWSVFVRDENTPAPISTMPGVSRFSIEELVDAAGKAVELGISLIALFPAIPHELKCEGAKECLNSEGLIPQTVAALKKHYPSLGVMTDVALDAYTSHGHDGLMKGEIIVNDETVELICQHALVHAEAGADIISPSDMMDGRVGEIRKALDSQGFHHVAIMSYAAKYASSFYGPFRDALGSKSSLGKGHKKTYQMDPSNVNEALREVALDIAEGADMVMVKPGLPYLDIIARVKDIFKVPTFAFQISGEYAMLKQAELAGWLNYPQALKETLIAFKRAGADGIITYAACEAADFIKRGIFEE